MPIVMAGILIHSRNTSIKSSLSLNFRILRALPTCTQILVCIHIFMYFTNYSMCLPNLISKHVLLSNKHLVDVWSQWWLNAGSGLFTIVWPLRFNFQDEPMLVRTELMLGFNAVNVTQTDLSKLGSIIVSIVFRPVSSVAKSGLFTFL